MKNKKGFTLIEILIVVAVLGILAGIILVKIYQGKQKARDAAIIEATNTIFKAAMIDFYSVEKYDDPTDPTYIKFDQNWIFNTNINPCADSNANFRFPDDPAKEERVRDACKKIISNIGNDFPGGGVGPFIIANASWAAWWFEGKRPPKLSLMVWLPNEKKYYCIASNGKSSKIQPIDGSGCSPVWGCPGCLLDLSGE